MINGYQEDQLIKDITMAYEHFFRVMRKEPSPPVKVEFYPYVNLNHTIRVRDGQVFVRLAEMAKDAPIYVQQALAQILVAKLLRRKVPKKADDIYREFSKHPLITERANHSKRTRGRKTMTGPKGRFYDLDELFNRINREFFDNALPKPALSWSKKKTKSILGHHDPIHDAIVISKTLDSLKVPVYVVDFVMFHEMLHIKHPTRTVNGRQQKHSRAFKLEEKRFPDMQRAEDWLRSF